MGGHRSPWEGKGIGQGWEVQKERVLEEMIGIGGLCGGQYRNLVQWKFLESMRVILANSPSNGG